MEVDAFLIFVLSAYAARAVGVWVLAIGAVRYAFVAAGAALPWMRRQLPPRYWRKVVAATQGVMLVVAAADILPTAWTGLALTVALALLTESFGRDVWWLWCRRGVEAGRIVVPVSPVDAGRPGPMNRTSPRGVLPSEAALDRGACAPVGLVQPRRSG
jgi:hypothetical protein